MILPDAKSYRGNLFILSMQRFRFHFSTYLLQIAKEQKFLHPKLIWRWKLLNVAEKTEWCEGEQILSTLDLLFSPWAISCYSPGLRWARRVPLIIPVSIQV